MARAKRVVPTVLLGVVVLVAAGAAFAWGGPGRGMGWDGPGVGQRGPGMRMMQAVYSLPDLTDSQRQSLQTLVTERATKMQEAFRVHRDARLAVRDALADGADSAKVRPLADKAAQAEVELMVLRADTHSAVNAILTDEQKAKLSGLRFTRGPGGNMPFQGSRQGGWYGNCPRL